MENLVSVLVASGHDKDCRKILSCLASQNDFFTAGVEKDMSKIIISAARLKPDVLIMDMHLQGMSWEELVPLVHRRSPETAIIIICDKNEENYASQALKAGISAFLLKETDMIILAPVIRIVISGGYYISAPILIKIFTSAAFIRYFPKQTFSSLAQSAQETALFDFSPTERSIVANIAQGYSDKQIAEYLHFSAGTVKNYITAIKRKTKLKNRVQIATFSLLYGLIGFEQLGFMVEKVKTEEFAQSREKKAPGT
jgi:DNA-binding NarL/FixJ family response regulator